MNEPSPYHIVVLCVGEGKQNKDKNIFGRIMRHRDPRLCGIGALGMYLMLRFQLTQEHKLFDFFDNNSWFNVKLIRDMTKKKKGNAQANANANANAIGNGNNQGANTIVSVQRSRYAYASNVLYDELLSVGEEIAAEWRATKHEYEKIMHKGAYTKKITMCLKALGISSKKKEHIGRDTAPAIMDIEEVCGLDQRNMGNWAVDVFQNSYSKRLPLGALRVLAGYSKERGKYKNPRTTFKGEECHTQLAKQIFPWVDMILSDPEIDNHTTSKGFLVFLQNMRWVILQDAVILTKVHGRSHCLFDSFPLCFCFPKLQFGSRQALPKLSLQLDLY